MASNPMVWDVQKAENNGSKFCSRQRLVNENQVKIPGPTNAGRNIDAPERLERNEMEK